MRETANPIRDLFDAALQHAAIRVDCTACPNTAVFNAAGLWWHFHKRDWAASIRNSGDRIYCKPCRVRIGCKMRPRVSVTHEPHTTWLDEPSKLEWKQACAKIR